MTNKEKCDTVQQEIFDILKRHDIGMDIHIMDGKPHISLWDTTEGSETLGLVIGSLDIKSFDGFLIYE